MNDRGVFLAQEVTARPDLSDHVHGEVFIVDLNPLI